MANAIHTRYELTGDLADLDRVIRARTAAVNTVRLGAPERFNFLANLGGALRVRYQRGGDATHLDRAIRALDEALAGTRPGSPDYTGVLAKLALSRLDRQERTGDTADLDQAIEALESAVAGTPAGSPDLPGYLNDLAHALRVRHEHGGDAADLRRAVDACRQSSTHGVAVRPSIGLAAAGNWGRWAASRGAWLEAAEAYRLAFNAMEALFRSQLLRRHRETWLREARGLPAEAAYALCKVDLPAEAAVTLERGRALLLSQALERDRAELDRLTALGHATLRDRYARATDRLQQLEAAEARPWQPDAAPLDRLAPLQTARAELDGAITAIREVPGYEHFLVPPDVHGLGKVAAEPLVYLAVANHGGVAVTIEPGPAVASLPLPGLTSEAVRRHLLDYLQAQGQLGDSLTRVKAVDRVTDWLWGAVMGPVLDALAPAARAVLVPGGYLGLLPLHAAWVEDARMPTGRRYALDDLLLTYAPNARALAAARRLAGRFHDGGLLAVEDPRPVNAFPLLAAAFEVEAAVAGWPRARRLRHKQATRAAVLGEIGRYPLLHFACHGYADLDDPLDSALLMAGGQRLTLRDLMESDLIRARLAVLSACETAVPGLELPDEVVSLPTGLLQAGAAGVIGSLWSVRDDSTAVLMARFYQLWRDDRLDAPEALGQAQQWVRDTTNGKQRDRFPGLSSPSGLSSATRTFWAATRAHAQPYHWAGFAYIGA